TSADDNRLLAFESAALTSSGFKAATAVIAPNAGSLSAPTGLAFDPAHRLWVANHDNGTLVRFDGAQLAAGGAPVPAVVLSGLGHPTALAFDGEGSLWVVGGAGTLTKFARTSLGASGAPEPSARLTITGHQVLWSAAFWPRPAGLPLN